MFINNSFVHLKDVNLTTTLNQVLVCFNVLLWHPTSLVDLQKTFLDSNGIITEHFALDYISGACYLKLDVYTIL
jgi:hypothetical protein